MKQSLLCALFVIINMANGQDRKALMKIDDNVSNLLVTPGDHIYIHTQFNEIINSSDIDSNFNITKTSFDKYGLDRIQIIAMFNQDSGIVLKQTRHYQDSGYIEVFFSSDGFKTLNKTVLKRESGTYNSFYNLPGHVWLLGIMGDIHFSNNFGQTWNKISPIYKLSYKLNSLFMLDSVHGYAPIVSN